MASALPAELKAALDRAAFGVSRKDAASRAAAISSRYRSGGGSQIIENAGDALAYAMTRMPATFAAVEACLDALAQALPGFAPASVLDLGAGPGTASWAAADIFPDAARFAAIDANIPLRDLALQLMDKNPRLRGIDYRQGDALAELLATPAADLVVAGYMAAELADATCHALFERAWEKTAGVLLIVEPGTPEGYRRVLAIRENLIARGARVAAPCPHEANCPLTPPDWCHFSRRLPRSRDHKQVKQAEVPFEDEKFCYVALSRTVPPVRHARILTPPQAGKAGITLKLCSATGLRGVTVPRRDKPAHAAARRLRWGGVMPDNEQIE